MNPGHFNYIYESNPAIIDAPVNTTILSFDESHFTEESKRPPARNTEKRVIDYTEKIVV